MPPGMLIFVYSVSGRLSRMTTFSPASSFALISCAGMRGVFSACSTNSPNALLGTLMPL